LSIETVLKRDRLAINPDLPTMVICNVGHSSQRSRLGDIANTLVSK